MSCPHRCCRFFGGGSSSLGIILGSHWGSSLGIIWGSSGAPHLKESSWGHIGRHVRGCPGVMLGSCDDEDDDADGDEP